MFRSPRGLLAAVATLIAVGGSGLLAEASSAALPSGCSKSGPRVTCTYTSGANPFRVPPGVFSIHVVAIGGAGSHGLFGSAGGPGARVEGDLAVVSGDTLYAVVGGNAPGRAPGANGGGTGGVGGGFAICRLLPGLPICPTEANAGGGGGGASDLRTSPDDLSSRLLVAAGGGGGGGDGGDSGAGGLGGAGGGGDGTAGGGDFPCSFGPNIVVYTGSAGGAGGAAAGASGDDGGPGSFIGIPPRPILCARVFIGGGGGGGGGGLLGGGGGAGLYAAGGGAGGGSNLVPTGGTASVDTTGAPLVQISYRHGHH